MATTKKNTTKKTNGSKATKTNGSKTKKTNTTKKKVEETNVVDEFLDTVVGETFTEAEAVKKEEVKESVADKYAKQAAELIKEAETGVIGEKGEDGTPYIKDLAETIVFPGIDTNELNCEPNREPNDELNHEMTGEEAYNLVMDNLHSEIEQLCDECMDKTEVIADISSSMPNTIELTDDEYEDLEKLIHESTESNDEAPTQNNFKIGVDVSKPEEKKEDLKCNLNKTETSPLSIVYVTTSMGVSYD